jgi:hypothetical protein
MRVIVQQHYSDCAHAFEGDDQEVQEQLLHAYPWLTRKYGQHAPVSVLVPGLDQAQAYSAWVENEPSGDIEVTPPRNLEDVLHGQETNLADCLRAASFLSGVTPSPDDVRAARVHCDDDPVDSALLACGEEPSEETRQALADYLKLSGLKKSEDPEPVKFKDVTATTDAGTKFAKIVLQASAEGEIKPVKLGGKHSKGTLVAYDKEKHGRYLLKPGSGPQNPAAGEHDTGSSQSKREAAFYAVAVSWGLAPYYPECHLLLIDGNEYAVQKMLSTDYVNGNELKVHDPNAARKVLQIYRHDGTLHKWAAVDFILGNADSNAGNMMFRGADVKLIDHGSAFAGDKFDPANDKSSFTPYYLRALAPAEFKDFTPDAKLKSLPRVNHEVDVQLSTWISGLDAAALADSLVKFGIDPAPCLKRLSSLKATVGFTAADMAINQLWVV